MNIRIQYQTSVTAVPGRVLRVIDRATKADIKILLCLCADASLCRGVDEPAGLAALAAASGCSTAQIGNALAFWRGAGIMEADESEETASTENIQPKPNAAAKTETAPTADPPVSETSPAAQPTGPAAPATPQPAAATAATATNPPVDPAPKKIMRRDSLPNYTTEELARLLEERADVRECLDECQRQWGKMFNLHEINVILGLVDYLGLEWDYVISLLTYCKARFDRSGKHPSLHYVEKTAFALYDDGVTTVEALNEWFRRQEMLLESEGQLRSLFGMGTRALTPKEKKLFSKWLYEYRYTIEIIRLAYNTMVDSTGKISLAYMDSVLANWNRDNLRTTADIEAAEAAFQSAKEAKAAPRKGNAARGSGSFDTNDFFADAVRRSLGDEFVPDNLK